MRLAARFSLRVCLSVSLGVSWGFCALAFAQASGPASGASGAASGAASNPELAATLALPISPGSIALLAEHPTDASAQQRVKEALESPQAEVRTVAARVVFDMGMRGLLPDVQAALAKEQDPVAGAEELRAWMTLAASPATYDAAVDAALRLGYPATSTVIDTMARLNARELLTYLTRLPHDPKLANAIMAVTTSDRPARARVAQELASDPGLLDPLLVAMHKDGDHPTSELLVKLLRSDDVKVRVVGIWYLALCQATDGTAMTPEVKAALDPLIDANATQVTWEAFGLELLSRSEHRALRERRWIDLAKAQRPPSAFHQGDDPLFLRLTDTELADYFEVTVHNRDRVRTFRQRVQSTLDHPAQKAEAAADQPMWATPNVGVRTLPPFVGGLWMDLYRLTGCQNHARPGYAIAVNVAYRPDGRPAQIATGDTNLPESCLRFARVLFSLGVADEARPRPAGFSDIVALLLQPAALTCADHAIPLGVEETRRQIATAASGAAAQSDTLVPPKQIEAFPLAYPQEARRLRLEGNVLIRGLLTPEGCFAQGTVVTSPSTLLSAPALFAMLNWRYQPATFGGRPVPVDTSLTVPFKLTR